MTPMSVVLALMALATRMAAAECDAATTSEAETDFKNCIESAQTTIVTTAGALTEAQTLCDSLNRTLSSCEGPKHRLAECKGRPHADNIERLHLSVTADIVKTVNRQLDVENCPVFQFQPIEMPVQHNDHDDSEQTRSERRDDEEKDEAEDDEGTQTLASGSPITSISFLLLIILSTFVRDL